MHIKLCNKLIYVSVVIIIKFGTASNIAPDIQLHTNDGNNKCVRKLQSCTLTLDDKQFGEPGLKGDKGDDGLPGSKGDKGSPGLIGLDGPAGAKGDKGSNGEKGDPGLPGIKGDEGPNGLLGQPGIPGKHGEMGFKGNKGEPGSHGAKGEMGIPSLQGPPGVQGMEGEKGIQGKEGVPGRDGEPGPAGPPGLNAKPCPHACSLLNSEEDYKNEDDGTTEFGTKDEPAGTTCKFAPKNLESGTYYLGPETQEMKVHCDMDTMETCLRSETPSQRIYYTGMNQDINKNNLIYKSKQGAFWLSDIIDLLSVYRLTREQITWLQQRSSFVSQTIRYNCINSVPYSSSNMSSSVHLLTWNDVMIGPYPSDATPFFYNVPTKTHFCAKGSQTQQYSDIVLRSNNVFRLPIRDIQIRDVRDELQMFYLESREICFL